MDVNGNGSGGWQLEWEGRIYTDDDLTLGHALVIGAQVGYRWEDMHPARSVLHLTTFLMVFEAVATGQPMAKIAASLNAQPLARIGAALIER